MEEFCGVDCPSLVTKGIFHTRVNEGRSRVSILGAASAWQEALLVVIPHQQLVLVLFAFSPSSSSHWQHLAQPSEEFNRQAPR